MTDIETAWENRSKQFGKKIEGVLPKSLPPVLNNYLDSFMFDEIANCIEDKPNKILDLGCGYGRLSRRLLQKYHKVETIGVDISQNYVDIYNRELKPRGKAIKGDIRKLPFENNSFDIVFMTTTIMYIIDSKGQEKVIHEMTRVLKPEGFLIIIERSPTGHKIFTLGGLLSSLRGKSSSEIASVSFTPNYMKEVLRKNKLKIIKISGIPFWTIFIHLNLVLSFINVNLLIIFLQFIKSLDKKFSSFLTPSMYISYISIKKND